MKLTKTEQALIERARTSYMGHGEVTSGVRPHKWANQTNRRFGVRERAALNALLRKGLVRIVHTHSHDDYKQGWCTRYNTAVYRLTETEGVA